MSQRKSKDIDRIFTKSFTQIAFINFFIWLGWQVLLTGLPLLATAHGEGTVYAGLMTTTGALAALIVRPLTGIATDTLGRKPVLITSVIAMIVLCFGNIIFPTGVLGLVIHFAQGVAWGFASTANSTLPLDVINNKRFAESMAFFGIFSSVATAFGPTITSELYNNNKDYMIVATCIVSLLITLVISIWLFKGGYAGPTKNKHVSFKETFSINKLIFSKAIFPSIFVCIMTLSLGCVQTFMALMCSERNLSDSYIYFMTFAVVAIVVRPVIGRITDKRGYYGSGIFACSSLTVAMLLVAVTTNSLMLFVSGVVTGVGLGAGGAVFQAMSVALSDKNSKGAATSTYMLFMNLGSAIGGLIGGVLASSLGYMGLFMVLAAIQAVSVVVYMMGGKKRIASYRQ